MKPLTKISSKIKNIDGIDEIKLSLLLHLLFFSILSLWFAQTLQKELKKEPKIVPVRLFAEIAHPTKKGTKLENTQTQASQQSKKAIAKPAKAPAKPKAKEVKTPKPPVVAKSNEKKVEAPKIKSSASSEKATTKPTKSAIEMIETTVAKEINNPSPKPVLIQEPQKMAEPIRPTHNLPTFETVSKYDLSKPASTPISPLLSGIKTSRAMPKFETELSTSNQRETISPDNYIVAPTNPKIEDNNEESARVEIGLIEAFGGNSETFTAPTILRRTMPEYPDWARESGIKGVAVYRVLIQQSGTVGDVITMSSTIDPKLAINGSQALRRWVFSPVFENGEPKETWVKITVQYQLN